MMQGRYWSPATAIIRSTRTPLELLQDGQSAAIAATRKRQHMETLADVPALAAVPMAVSS